MAKRSARFTHAVGGVLDNAPGPLRAALAALEAASLSMLLLVLPVFLVWLASPNVTAGGWHAVQLGLAGWCLGQGGAVTVRIGTVSLVPLLCTTVALLLAVWSAGRLAAGLARKAPGRLRRVGDLRRDVAVEGGVFVGVYTLAGLVAALLARTPDFAPSAPRTLIGAVFLGAVAYVLGLRVEFRADLRDVAPGWAPARRVPAWARAGWSAAWASLVWLLLAGLLLVVLMVVVRFDRIAGLYDSLSPGVIGGLVLTGVQLLYVPNLSVWALSWLVGPGFGVGVDSAVTLTTAQPGLLPLVPVLGALPEPGPLPVLTRVALVLPIAVGAFLERRSSRYAGPELLDRALAAATACVVAAAAAMLLGLASGGALGSGRLAAVGPPAFLFGALLGGELALGAAISLAVRSGRRSLRRPEPHGADTDDTDDADEVGAGPVRR